MNTRPHLLQLGYQDVHTDAQQAVWDPQMMAVLPARASGSRWGDQAQGDVISALQQLRAGQAQANGHSTVGVVL